MVLISPLCVPYIGRGWVASSICISCTGTKVLSPLLVIRHYIPISCSGLQHGGLESGDFRSIECVRRKHSLHVSCIVCWNFYFIICCHMYPGRVSMPDTYKLRMKHTLQILLQRYDKYLACNYSFTTCKIVLCRSTPRERR